MELSFVSFVLPELFSSDKCFLWKHVVSSLKYVAVMSDWMTPVKLVTYYLFDIRGAKQSLPNK